MYTDRILFYIACARAREYYNIRSSLVEGKNNNDNNITVYFRTVIEKT